MTTFDTAPDGRYVTFAWPEAPLRPSPAHALKSRFAKLFRARIGSNEAGFVAGTASFAEASGTR